jgi:phosphohistidine phosphatase
MAIHELLLLRHGLAEDREQAAAAGRPDDERPLTAEGRRRTAQVAERLLALELQGVAMLSSPLLRARQTAEIACQVGLAPGFELAPPLAPQGDPLPLLTPWLAPSSPGGRLVLVGHEPDLSELACRLCGAPPGSLQLKKAGVVLLELPKAAAAVELPGRCRLTLLLTPRSLRI